MKNLFLFILLFLITCNSFAQKVISGTSESKFVSITKDPPKPPYLEITQGSIQFIDSDGNKKINASENCKIQFELTNSGQGPAIDMRVKVNESSFGNGLIFDKETTIGSLEANQKKTVEIPISASMGLQSGKALFYISVADANGFGVDPVPVEIETQILVPPSVKIVDWKASSQSGTSLIKQRPFDLQVLVQNTGQGQAKDVNVSFSIPDNMFLTNGNALENIGFLDPGEQKLLNYSLVTNNMYNKPTISLVFHLNEYYNKYAEDKTISLQMDQKLSNETITIKGTQNPKPAEIVIGSLSSAVDKNIPLNSTKYPKRLALVIGNENYSTATLNSSIDVKYAINDAEIFAKYCTQTLGVQSDNMFILINATRGTMNSEIQRVAKLLDAFGNDAELIFYYAGHGFPDEHTKVPYLIPVDVNPANLVDALPLSEVYQKFGESGAKRVTVFLDACFSGGGRDQGLIAGRSVAIKPEEVTLTGHTVVFSASTNDQFALPYDQEKHGMFTYFLLKKLQETSGAVTFDELVTYLEENTNIESLRINKRSQQPQVSYSPDVSAVWRTWSFK